MADLIFQHPIGQKESQALARRRSSLVKLVPDIAKAYEKHRKSARIQKLADAQPKVMKETLAFYNAVVTDGRFVKLLEATPEAAAEKLGVQVSREALSAIRDFAKLARNPGPVQGPVEAVIAVAVVVAVALSRPAEGAVLDSSANVRTKL